MVGPLTDVLYEIADGSNQKEIAANLNISYNLVRDYVARLYTILGSYDVMSTLRAGYVQGHLLMCPTCRRPSDRARRRQ
jgi:DNA-binding NarL/FixJ family response regulator